jgi:hypothetical protein
LSKLNYLVYILVLSIIGYVVIGQLKQTTETALQLIGAEIHEKIEIKIAETYRELKRYPNPDNEFETLVLGRLDFSRYPLHIKVQNFHAGNALYPATFQVVIKGKTTIKPVTLFLRYSGRVI